MYTVRVDTSGPVYNGRAKEILDDFTREAVWEITKEGRGALGVRFITVFKNPTGNLESKVDAQRPIQTPGGWASKIDGETVRYAWWIEGIGSRNYPATRFRGYHSFKTIAQVLDAKAVTIAERALPPFLARINGGA